MPAASDVKIKITAQDKTKAAFNKVKSNLKTTAATLRKIQGGLAILGVGSVAAISKLGEAALANNKIFVDISRRLGDSAGEISEFALSAKAAGVEIAGSTIALQRQTRRIGEAAQGYGEARKAIQDLGLSAKELAQLTPTQAFDKISTALLDIDNNAQRVATAFKLWDTEGVALVQTLEDMQRIRERIQNTGATVTNQEAAAFRELREEIEITNAKFLALQQDFVESGIPATLERWKQSAIDFFSVIGSGFGAMSEIVASIALGEFAAIPETIARRWKEMQDAAAGVNRELAGVAEKQGQIAESAAKTSAATQDPDKFERFIDGLKRQNELLSLQASGNDLAATKVRAVQQAEALLGVQRYQLGIDQRKRIGEQIDQQEALKEKIKELATTVEDTASKMSVFAEQAARNMQDSFANFLFDPFKEDGLKGMLDGFVTTLRQMAAQAASAKIFESLGGLSGSGNSFVSAIGTFFGSASSNATGGPLRAGELSRINEIEPEFFVPRTSGMVIPLSKMPETGGTINVSVTAPPSSSSQSASQFGFEVAQALRLADSRNG